MLTVATAMRPGGYAARPLPARPAGRAGIGARILLNPLAEVLT